MWKWIQAQLDWLKSVFSDDSSASFGRIISIISFACMLVTHMLILKYPQLVTDKTQPLIQEFMRYCFTLAAGGYSVTKFGETLSGLWPNIFGKRGGDA